MKTKTWRAKRQDFSCLVFQMMCLLLLAGCSSLVEPTSTSTPRPTATYIPFDMRPATPIGTPVGEWHHIPVMPGATAGSGDELGYSFIVQATAEEVQAFYKDHMPKLGWEYDATGGGEAGEPLMVFKKGSYIITISYFPQEKGMLVLLVR